MTDPIPGSRASLAEGSADFAWDGHALEKGIGLALSGGGFRAMLFRVGRLPVLFVPSIRPTVIELNELIGISEFAADGDTV